MAEDKKRLDIFRTLTAIDLNDKKYYKNLTDDEKKLFTPSVVARWLSSVTDSSGLSEYYCLMTNEIVNVGFWDLYKHPELQYLLMTLVGSGKKMRHEWIPISKKNKKGKIEEMLMSKYPLSNKAELELLLNKHTADDIKQLALDMAYDDKTIDLIMDEWKLLKNE